MTLTYDSIPVRKLIIIHNTNNSLIQIEFNSSELDLDALLN